MDSLQVEIADELRRIIDIVEDLTLLSSRWSGHVELVRDAPFKGKKPFRCDIQIDAALAATQERWSTLIHEALHTVSAGYVRNDYQDFQGWEEGVVEQLQRFFRAKVLSLLRVIDADEAFETLDVAHAYNGFIAALERLRQAVGVSEEHADVEAFYLRLLATPIKDRPELVLGMA